MSDLRIGVVGVGDGWSTNQLLDRVEKRTGFRCLVELDDVAVNLASGAVLQGATVLNELDALIVKKIGRAYSPRYLDRLETLRYLEARGPKVFSRPESIRRAMDRYACTLILQQRGIPIPPTVVTESIDAAVEAVTTFGRAVLKPLYTSKARGMIVVEPGANLRADIEQFRGAGNQLMYIQKMMELPGRDLGLVFLGGEYLGTYARVSGNGSWNTTTHSGGRYEPHEPTEELIDLARRAQEPFDLVFTSVDVAETPEGPVVFEVSAFGGFRGLHVANGTDAATHLVDHVISRLRQL